VEDLRQLFASNRRCRRDGGCPQASFPALAVAAQPFQSVVPDTAVVAQPFGLVVPTPAVVAQPFQGCLVSRR
jgi:hypothetical protein